MGTGTSQGVPVIGCTCPVCLSTDERDKRLRSSILVEHKGQVLVVDTGPDFRQQMLRARVRHLDAVLFTHAHRDHTAGLDDIRSFNFIQGHPADIYATKQTQKELKKQFAYIFENHTYPGIPKINLHDIGDQPFQVGNITVHPVFVLHYKMPVVGFRIENFTYITDANYIAPEEQEKIKGSEVLVLNALRREHHVSHFTLQEAIDLGKVLEIPTTYLTHISHQMGKHAEVEAELPGGCKLAYDNLVLDL